MRVSVHYIAVQATLSEILPIHINEMLDKLTPHCCGHTYITMLQAGGVAIDVTLCAVEED